MFRVGQVKEIEERDKKNIFSLVKTVPFTSSSSFRDDGKMVMMMAGKR